MTHAAAALDATGDAPELASGGLKTHSVLPAKSEAFEHV